MDLTRWRPPDPRPAWLRHASAQTAVAGLLAGPLAVALVWWRLWGRLPLRLWLALLGPLLGAIGLGLALPRPYADHAVLPLMLVCTGVWAWAVRRRATPQPLSWLQLAGLALVVSALNAVGLLVFSYGLYQVNLAALKG